MSAPGVTNDPRFPVPRTMMARVLDDPECPSWVDKPMPSPGVAEVLVRIEATAIRATDIETIAHGKPALVQGGLPEGARGDRHRVAGSRRRHPLRHPRRRQERDPSGGSLHAAGAV